MLAANFLVCERTGHWAVAWRGVLAPHGVRVHETRSLAECTAELAARPASVVALDQELASAQQLLDWLAGTHAHFPYVRTLLLCVPGGCEWEWLAREAGAMQVVHSQLELSATAVSVRARLAEFPRPPADPIHQVYDILPWRRYAERSIETKFAREQE